MNDGDRDALVEAVERIPALYIADGHHRAASAARARTELRERRLAALAETSGTPGTSPGADAATFLAVAFPDNQVQILPYNRVVKDLGGMTPGAFLEEVRRRFELVPGPAAPARKGEFAMYVQGSWYTLRSHAARHDAATTAALDVSVLQDELLAPVLKIEDVRTDPRIEFVGGARGTGELEQLVDSGRAAVAFSLYPGGRRRPDGGVGRGSRSCRPRAPGSNPSCGTDS